MESFSRKLPREFCYFAFCTEPEIFEQNSADSRRGDSRYHLTANDLRASTRAASGEFRAQNSQGASQNPRCRCGSSRFLSVISLSVCISLSTVSPSGFCRGSLVQPRATPRSGKRTFLFLQRAQARCATIVVRDRVAQFPENSAERRPATDSRSMPFLESRCRPSAPRTARPLSLFELLNSPFRLDRIGFGVCAPLGSAVRSIGAVNGQGPP